MVRLELCACSKKKLNLFKSSNFIKKDPGLTSNMVLLELQKKTGLWWNPDLINKCLMEFYIYLVILIRLISLQWPRSPREVRRVKYHLTILMAHSSIWICYQYWNWSKLIWNVHGLNQSWGTCMGVDDLWNGQTILHGLNQVEVHIWGDWWSVKWTDNYCCSLNKFLYFF